MQLVSLNVSMPQTITYDQWQVETSGNKQPVPSAMLRFENLEGNVQADLENHGGPEKAVCAYPQAHYPFWEHMLEHALAPGAFSENLTLAGDDALETEVCIGDIWQIGEAVLQVAGPRMPCRKLAARLGDPRVIEWSTSKGYTGHYMRVLREGNVPSGVNVHVLEHNPAKISIDAVNDIFYRRSRDPQLIAKLLALPEYGESGKQWINEMLTHDPAWMDELLRAQMQAL